LEVRHRWRRRARPHVRPDEPAALDARIGRRADFLSEVALRRLAREIDTAAGLIELPSVIDAAQPFALVATVKQAGAPVRTRVLHQADRAGSGAIGDEILAEQTHAERRALGLRQLTRERRGNPVLTHERAHRRAASDATEEL